MALNHARLPVPPPRQVREDYTYAPLLVNPKGAAYQGEHLKVSLALSLALSSGMRIPMESSLNDKNARCTQNDDRTPAPDFVHQVEPLTRYPQGSTVPAHQGGTYPVC